MTLSMTGFASGEGALSGWSWSWDLRAVNGRGLDLRLRVPDWIEGLEPALRQALQAAISRGNVTLSLRLTREAGPEATQLNAAALDAAIRLIAALEERAISSDLALAQTTAADILSMRGVLDTTAPEDETEALKSALLAEVPALLAAFNANRAQEGAALAELLSGQIDRVNELVGEARALADVRRDKMRESLEAALARVTGNADIDPQRVAQELAVIAVKADVTEEMDRLDAHVAAARALMAAEGPKGRKLDFLTQEFNREANTLCSKAQFAELTRIGLDLKHTIDQMREQVQNVE